MLKGEVKERPQSLLDEGKSMAEVARTTTRPAERLAALTGARASAPIQFEAACEQGGRSGALRETVEDVLGSLPIARSQTGDRRQNGFRTFAGCGQRRCQGRLKEGQSIRKRFQVLVRPERLELPAYWFEASRSIQLSYGRTLAVRRR